jgi:predicted RecB family nuclease
MCDLDLMKEIESYNEVDCRVMAEVLDYLRRSR